MKKNILLLISILLFISFVGLPQNSFAADKQSLVEKEEKHDKQDKPKTTKIEIFPNSIAGMPVKNITTILSSDEILSKEKVYSEYGVEVLEEAFYNDFQVRIFSSKYPAQAYGLYTFYRDPLASTTDFGTEGDLDVVEGKIIFWQGTKFVQIINSKADRSAKTTENMLKLGQSISEKILALDQKTMVAQDIELAKKLPSVIRNLPEGSLNLRTAKYILGTESLEKILGRSVTQYDLYPNMGTEIAYATYEQESGKSSLLIIEHHTPQQSIAAFKKLSDYRDSLPETEKNKLILKREGNYIIEAENFSSVEVAKKLTNDVKYSYAVKWLNNDDIPVNNGRTVASEAIKTGKILVSVFGLIGVGLIFAMIGGISLGFLVFYFRRRNKVAVDGFSDAGGMMRLNIDNVIMPNLPTSESGKNLIGNGK